MKGPVAIEARVDQRFPASAVPSITGLRLSSGDAVELVNISRSGILVEGRTRLVPATRLTMIVEGSFTPKQIEGRVVRCQVSSISDGELRYQSGIEFQTRLQANPTEIGGGPAEPGAAASAPPEPPPPSGVRLVNRW